MTALKDILLETNITFTKEGIKIINMDKSHTVLAHLALYADRFESYECKHDKIIIGANMLHLFKLINTIDNDDTLTIYIEEADYKDGVVQYLGLKFENGQIKQQKIQKLRLIEPELEELAIPDVTFSSVLNMPSADFQKIIRDLSCISDKIEIRSIATNEGAELIFKCSGGFAQAEIIRAETDGSMEYIHKQEASKIIQGEFSLKNLSYFIKCTNLCNQIEMYLDNDLPLVVKYNVASLGEIKLCLSTLPSC
jgi:proliferating cell nuclear antigen